MNSPPMSFLSAKAEIRASGIHGRGLFARSDIAKDEVVAVKGGHIFGRITLGELKATLGPSEIQISDDLFIGPVNQSARNGSMIFSNHSCDPNIGVQGQIVFVAMRNIHAGEELTHDWATTDCDEYEMSCNCGAPDCRKIITGRDWMKPELQQKYRGYFSWYLQQKFRLAGG